MKTHSAFYLIFLGATLASSPIQAQTYYNWMSSDIRDAWTQGYKGQGTTITVIDDYNSTSKFSGNFGDGKNTLLHGEWTFKEINMMAPSAFMSKIDFTQKNAVSLAAGLNVLNLSYGIFASASHTVNQITWDAQDRSIINSAQNGTAISIKAAGNNAISITSANSAGQKDFLNLALIGAPTAIFVGALDRNGTTSTKASMATYSNFAGTDTNVQKNFVVVGVRGDVTGLNGTSFAAPVISAYAGVLGSKFTTATATQITNQLLTTARQDTILNYNVTIHGRGEASISRALAPVAIK